jgi:hypothetical protein
MDAPQGPGYEATGLAANPSAPGVWDDVVAS